MDRAGSSYSGPEYAAILTLFDYDNEVEAY